MKINFEMLKTKDKNDSADSMEFNYLSKHLCLEYVKGKFDEDIWSSLIQLLSTSKRL